MATTALRGTPVETVADLPAVGSIAPSYVLTGDDLAEVTSDDLTGRTVLNIFPSIDTGVCAMSVRKFNELAAAQDGVRVVCVSHDLPFALKRFCGAEGIANVTVASAFRSSFGTDYGVTLTTGPMRGLLARAVVVLDADRTVRYVELVPDITQEPDYDGALGALA